MKKILASIIFLIVFTLSVSPIYAGTLTDNFNDGNADGWWLGYSQHVPSINGNWRVEDIGSPHYGVLNQDSGGDHFIALVNGIESSDQSIETEIRLNGFGSYGGVTVWFHNDANWTDVLLYPAAGFIDVLEQRNGIENHDYHAFSSSTNTWYKIKAIARGTAGEIEVYINDIYVFTHSAVTTYRSGLSGVNNGNAGAYFDNFSLTSASIADPLTNKDQCKNEGWKTFSSLNFKNQGACLKYVEGKVL